MVLVRDIVLVHLVRVDSLRAVLPPDDVHVAFDELGGKVVDDSTGIVGEEQQLALMGLAHGVALEAVLIPALLGAHLAVPAEFLQSLGLHFVGQVFRRSCLCTTHLESPVRVLRAKRDELVDWRWNNRV